MLAGLGSVVSSMGSAAFLSSAAKARAERTFNLVDRMALPGSKNDVTRDRDDLLQANDQDMGRVTGRVRVRNLARKGAG